MNDQGHIDDKTPSWAISLYKEYRGFGQPAGFFCYSVNTENNIGFLKFVIIDKTKRGKGRRTMEQM